MCFWTRKLPTFLSRLNEISGGCEKNAPVSGSFCTFSRHFFLGTLSHWRQLRNDVYDDCDVIVPVQGRTDYCLPTLLTVLTPPPEGLAFAFRRSCLLWNGLHDSSNQEIYFCQCLSYWLDRQRAPNLCLSSDLVLCELSVFVRWGNVACSKCKTGIRFCLARKNFSFLIDHASKLRLRSRCIVFITAFSSVSLLLLILTARRRDLLNFSSGSLSWFFMISSVRFPVNKITLNWG